MTTKPINESPAAVLEQEAERDDAQGEPAQELTRDDVFYSPVVATRSLVLVNKKGRHVAQLAVKHDGCPTLMLRDQRGAVRLSLEVGDSAEGVTITLADKRGYPRMQLAVYPDDLYADPRETVQMIRFDENMEVTDEWPAKAEAVEMDPAEAPCSGNG